MAFNAKNLTYEKQEPAFLRKLKGQYGGDSERHERPLARPRKLKADDEDDEPVYVDEESQDTISKADYQALVETAAGDGPRGAQAEGKADEARVAEVDAAGTGGAEPVRIGENVVGVGGRKKRKAVKVVKGDGDTSEPEDTPPVDRAKADGKATKRKKTKLKLSFDDEGEK
ncbi:MAG: hypothetical protein M1832_003424 [Thelocarpon impressellum]|nr:MAG: hypothetical protein M1832_003424 [Thelocarpon impressellum]